jgi:hypothetical protein
MLGILPFFQLRGLVQSRIMIQYWTFMVIALPATIAKNAMNDPSASVDTPVMP